MLPLIANPIPALPLLVGPRAGREQPPAFQISLNLLLLSITAIVRSPPEYRLNTKSRVKGSWNGRKRVRLNTPAPQRLSWNPFLSETICQNLCIETLKGLIRPIFKNERLVEKMPLI